MSSKNQKQKKGIYYSIAVIALGCVISSIYSNSSINRLNEYQIDLSKLDQAIDTPNAEGSTSGENAEALQNAGVAQDLTQASGSDVINPVPSGMEIAEAQRQMGEQALDALKPASDELTGEMLPQDAQTTMASATLSFEPEEGMGWPLNGDVILGYSMDKSIFFETLEQYRYNPAIYISANEGDTVSACAKGQVTEIGNDPQIGTFVKTGLGNGYEVTYGQLKDLQVKENDVVARGQVIGSVAQSTIYYTKEGNHVYLEIEKDGKPVNPMSMLE